MDARVATVTRTTERARFLIRPNRSLPRQGMWVLCAAFAVLVLTIGGGFSLLGAWLVLPFAGLEVMIVGSVFYLLHRHSDDYELIVIDGENVHVRQRVGAGVRRHAFQRYWARVSLTRCGGWYPSRLMIGSHGRCVELGAQMEESARRTLAQELTRVLRDRSATDG